MVRHMKILVPVKHVPDVTGDRAFADDGTVDATTCEPHRCGHGALHHAPNA
jgi:hypothetical protein